MKNLLLFLVLLLFLFNSNLLIAAEDYNYKSNRFILQDIHLEGLRRITISTALLSLPISVGDLINNDDIANTIQALFSTGNFEDVRIFRDKNKLIIKLKERAVIANIKFYGNKIIKDNLLRENLEALNIRIGEFFDRNKLANIKRAIEDFYLSIGQYNATVKVNIRSLPFNRVEIIFIFSEEFSATIHQINIIGNRSFNKNQLLNCFKLRDNISWLNYISDRKYNQQKLLNDLESLRNFYLDRGYARFDINSVNISLTPDKKYVYITINISEGDRYTVSSIKLNSEISLPIYNEINGLFKLKLISIYNRNEITNLENKIKDLLCRYGYAYPKVNHQLEINDENKTVKIYINVYPESRFYVRKIRFIGNHFTKDSVLRREISQMEGAWLSTKLVKLGKEKLYRTGFFEDVDVEIKPALNTIDKVDIIYRVKECNTGSINFGIGLGTESGLSFQVSIKQKNFFGTGNAIGLSAVKNDYSKYGELFFNAPYITFNGISLGGRVFSNTFSAKDADLSCYNNNIYGFDNILSFPVSENNVVRIGTGFVHNSLYDMIPQIGIWRYLRSMGKPLSFNENNNLHRYHNNELMFNLGFTLNNLDRNLFPRRGNKTSLNSKITITSANNQYYKLRVDTGQYCPIDRYQKWIILGKLQLGYGNGFNFKELPFYENFYAGGTDTVRGFHNNNIGPKAIYLEKDKNNEIKPKIGSPSMDAVGGNAMVIASMELITPKPFLISESIRTSVFIDAGTVWDSNWKYTPASWRVGMPDYANASRIRMAAGISLQWMSPLGPLVFSYAKPIKYYEYDKLEEFQFSLGSNW